MREPAPPAEAAEPCPVMHPGPWHEYHARRHREHLPADAAQQPTGNSLTARFVWHRDWAQWHEQQAQAHRD